MMGAADRVTIQSPGAVAGSALVWWRVDEVPTASILDVALVTLVSVVSFALLA